MPTHQQLDELRHIHVFGCDSLVPVTNIASAERELFEAGLLDRSGPEVVFLNRPIPSHWRYTLNDAGRAAIVEADGCLPKQYDWEAEIRAMQIDDDAEEVF